MKICVYTIVKNEEKFLKRWYDSAKDADSLVIVDTGSTDNTLKIAQELGITTYSINVEPFRFDVARNSALALLPKDIDLCISLDADEILTENWRKTIEDLWNEKPFTLLSCDYITPVNQLKYVFKIHSRYGYRWKGCVHEDIVADQRINERRVTIKDTLFKHIQDSEKSREFYHDLLKITVEEDKDSRYYAFNLFQYALSLFRKEQQQEALLVIEKCLEVCKQTKSANLSRVSSMRDYIKNYIDEQTNSTVKKEDDTYIIEPKKKNAVLGVALGLKLESINPFINSFLSNNTTDDLVLFLDTDTFNKLNKNLNKRVQTYIFNPDKVTSETRVNNSRFLAYPEFLEENSHKYKHIFLTDVRDVIFQKNIFENLPNSYLYFFSEDNGILINQEKNNSKWIMEDYGFEILKKIGDNNIVCSGTVLGDIDTIKNFLKVLIKEFNKIKETNPEIYKTGYLDQGVFNYIAYELSQSNYKIQSNGNIIGTLCLSSLSKFAKDKIKIEDDFIKVNNMTPAVVHQYDRNKPVFEFLNKKYS